MIKCMYVLWRWFVQYSMQTRIERAFFSSWAFSPGSLSLETISLFSHISFSCGSIKPTGYRIGGRELVDQGAEGSGKSGGEDMTGAEYTGQRIDPKGRIVCERTLLSVWSVWFTRPFLLVLREPKINCPG